MDSDSYFTPAFRKLARGKVLLLLGLGLTACGEQTAPARVSARPSLMATVDRTSYGVVHVKADTFSSLGYGLAYAYAQDNVCMFADTLLTVRGERSRFFGGAAKATAPVNGDYGAAIRSLDLDNETSDFFFKGYLDIAQLRKSYAAGSVEVRDMLAGYAAGYNRYLNDHAGRLPKACAGAAWVRPITADDMFLVVAEKALHASGEVFAKEIVQAARSDGAAVSAPVSSNTADSDFVQQRLARISSSQLGSNALALGQETSANGRGILLANPHYPWTSTDRFYQAHLTVPGRYDAMGVILGGIPIVVIGFNRDLAWTHTVTTAAHFTTFRLKLDPADPSGTTYLMDGRPVKMSSRAVTIELLQPDGSLRKKSKTFYVSSQGALMVKPDAGMVWDRNTAHVLADPNLANTRLMEQWLAIGSARNVAELKASLDKHVGLPWVNTIAADRAGDTLFADASVVPNMGSERFAGDCLLAPALLMFDGARAQCGWGSDPHAPAGLTYPGNAPWTVRRDYVGNSNDSYWLSNAKAWLSGPAPYGYSPLYGRVAIAQKLRTRAGFLQIEEALADSPKLRLADVQRLAFANRIYAAELILPDLLPLCAGHADRAITGACEVLSSWDRRNDLDSRGAVLFREFWTGIDQRRIWAVPFDAADPLGTPRGITPEAGRYLLTSLGGAADKLTALGIALDARLGDYQIETRNGMLYEVHGGIGDTDGAYNSIHVKGALAPGGYGGIEWGTSYVQTVGFDADGPIAYGMLVYGQSVDPASLHASDQLPLYAKKQWPLLPFTAAEVKADPNFSTLTLSE